MIKTEKDYVICRGRSRVATIDENNPLEEVEIQEKGSDE